MFALLHVSCGVLLSVFLTVQTYLRTAKKVQWVARHELLSVSVASNIPGFEQPRCFITDGDSKKLVESMMSVLESMSETVYNELEDFDADVFE